MRSYCSFGDVQTGCNFLVLQAFATQAGYFFFSSRQMDALIGIIQDNWLFQSRCWSRSNRYDCMLTLDVHIEPAATQNDTDQENLCKGKVSSAQSPTRTALQAHVVVEVSVCLLNLPFAFCTLDSQF